LKFYKYTNEDRSLIVNENDRELSPIEIPLPKAPAVELIQNYGLKADDQVFTREKIPDKVLELNERFNEGQFSLDELWAYIDANQRKFKEEIAFIADQVNKRLYGMWVYIDGKPTYLNGWNFFYLNYWPLDNGLPEYRDRDRKFFHFAKFCYDDPYCFGFNYPKHRREGATSKASCIHFCVVTQQFRVNGGIQSMTDDHAEVVFQTHVVEPWRTLPFYFKPTWDGSNDPKTKLSFKAPAKNVSVTGRIPTTANDLRSQITFKEASPKAFDTWKLHFWHGDEAGKGKNIDAYERWQVVRQCLAQGNGLRIHGMGIHTSTVGEMDKGGGRNFLRICQHSMFHQRNKNNQTTTGLYNFFIPAYEGLEGFIGKFGESVIDAPGAKQTKALIDKLTELSPTCLK